MNTNKKWLIIAGAVVVVGLGVWLYLLRMGITSAAEDGQKVVVAELVRAQAPSYVVADDFKNTDPKHTDQIFGALWKSMQSPDYVRMKIWNPDYTVIWSNLPELIGQKFAPFDEFDEAMKNEVVFDLESQKSENIGERQYDVLGETYVPFTDAQGKVVGVIELYNVPTLLNSEIAGEFTAALPLPIATAIVVYAIFAFLLSRYGKKGMATPPPANPAA